MIEPVIKDDELLNDILSAPADSDTVSLWWLGQSGYLFKWLENYLLLDPYLSDSLTKKYAGTAMEHIRMTARCISPEKLGFVTMAFSSHAHTDHLDAATLTEVAAAVAGQNRRLRLVLSPANIPVAREKLGDALVDFLGLNAGSSLEADGFSIAAIPSAHTELKQNSDGEHLFIGFILRLGPWTIYHSGDTVLYPGLVETLRSHHPQVVLLPINGNRPERGIAGNLSGAEAAWLAYEAEATVAIPCHYDMFTFNTESPDEFIHKCHKLAQPYRILKCGERLTLSAD